MKLNIIIKMDIVDVLYEIKFNETNFTAIKELVEHNVTEYWFQFLTVFYMVFLLFKNIEMEHYFEEQLNLLDVKFHNHLKIMENDLKMDLRIYISKLNESEYEETDESEDKCDQLIKDPDTGETRYCKNYPIKDSEYCNVHHKKVFEDDEEFKSLITESEENDSEEL